MSKYGSNFVIEQFDDEFILTDSRFKQISKEEDPNIKLPSIEEEIDITPSSSSIDDLLDELDESEPPAKRYKDFFGNDGSDNELKDIDFESLID